MFRLRCWRARLRIGSAAAIQQERRRFSRKRGVASVWRTSMKSLSIPPCTRMRTDGTCCDMLLDLS
jgi:hypothetical protein